jgi:hypothetical protein
MAEVKLTRRSVNKINNSLKTQIQVGKVKVSKLYLRGLQANDDFPPDEDITSYVTSVNAKNRYQNINTFWKTMEKAPKFWKSKFIYKAAGDESLRIQEAAAMAISLTEQQTRAYPQPDKNGVMHTTGHLFNSIRTFVNGAEKQTPLVAISRETLPPLFQIVNVADYGSTAEAYATYSALKGLIFYAANKVQTKYPDLGIVFAYAKGPEWGSGRWDVPVLSIGSKQTVSGRWSRPGSRIKRRKRFISNLRRRGVVS